MKKRRTLIISLLLVAAMALGIAYAAVDGLLIIDGKVQTVKQPFNVHFTYFEQGVSHAEITGNAPAVTCADQFPSKSIMLNVSGMATKDDYVTALVTITNDNDCAMYVVPPTIKYGADASATSSENIDVTVEGWTSAIKIEAGDEKVITIKVRMKTSCTDETYQEFFRLSITGTPTDPDA